MPAPDSFYPPELTARSREVLGDVCRRLPQAVLIGGWGTWVRARGAMSHDIDLIVDRADIDGLRAVVDDMSESRHLAGRQWQGTLQGIQLHLYAPFQSWLGDRLALRTERLVGHREVMDGWNVLTLPAHMATKVAALLDRPDSWPGEKDRQEIVDLLALEVDTSAFAGVVTEASNRERDEVADLLAEAFDYLQDLDLDRRQRRRLRAVGAECQQAVRALSG